MDKKILINRILKSMYMGFLLCNVDNKYSESDISSFGLDDTLFFLNKFNTDVNLKNKYNIIEFNKRDDFTFFTVYGDLVMITVSDTIVKEFINLVLKNYKKVFYSDNGGMIPVEIDIFDLNTLEKLSLYNTKDDLSIYEGSYRKHYSINKLNLFKIY